MNNNPYEEPKKQIGPGVWALPRVKIGKEYYFRDDRLQEFRNTERPWDTISFSEYDAASRLKMAMQKTKKK